MKLINSIVLKFLILGFLLVNLQSKAEILEPVKWSFSAIKISDGVYDIIGKAKIDPKWHIYSQDMVVPADALTSPVKTLFVVDANKSIVLIGRAKESGKIKKEYDKNFELTLAFIEDQATYSQRVKINPGVNKITGKYTFMSCDDKQCLQPTEDAPFEVQIKDNLSSTKTEIEKKPEALVIATSMDSLKMSTTVSNDSIKEVKKDFKEKLADNANKEISQDTWWTLFVKGLLSGLLGLLSPCVYSMIPLTVSFFTKGSGSRKKGIINAVIYGISIVVIYVALGVLVAALFGGDALNKMASNVYLNIFFFLLFVVFAISFLGAFEIQLPSSWTNKSDKMSDKGGVLGIFFMAFTLALVSFSCTAPIIGNALAIISSGNGIGGPIFGMLGFGTALALPFTLFAIFPTWLNSMPKSGGWLNSIKVALGIIELAIAFKFLSAVDLAYHWDFLKREYFLAIWIILFALLGFNLLGFLRFSHDSETKYVSIPRFLFATLSLAFSLYMIPGLFGAPVNLLSGLAPPSHHNEGIWMDNTPQTKSDGEVKKYGNLFHAPHGLDLYFDYEQALSQSKKTGKPLMIDFTGHSCVNCRLMESSIWSKPEVLKRMNEDFIIVSLYVDDKTKLPENEQYISKLRGKKVATLGEKWSDLQATRYNSNSQPLYLILNHNEETLSGPIGYNPDEQLFIDFLDTGKKLFTK